jgi:hypothetical protein
MNGIEPSTSALTKQRSTAELRPHRTLESGPPGDRTRTPEEETLFESVAYTDFRQRSANHRDDLDCFGA